MQNVIIISCYNYFSQRKQKGKNDIDRNAFTYSSAPRSRERNELALAFDFIWNDILPSSDVSNVLSELPTEVEVARRMPGSWDWSSEPSLLKSTI